MLLKYSQPEKKPRTNGPSKQQRGTGNMKLTLGAPVVPQRIHRKVMKGVGTKRPATGQQRVAQNKAEERTTVDPCDNSNDSGLGFDHHLDYPLATRSTLRFVDQEHSWVNEHPELKRRKMEIKLESDDANDNFSFPDSVTMTKRETPVTAGLLRSETVGLPRPAPPTRSPPARSQSRPQSRSGSLQQRRSGPASLTSQLLGISRNGKSYLQIVCQPEQQHRARYQTEGSRGAVKDRSGNAFPAVQLVGYDGPATLQVFIGTDVGRVAPHMFYQACRVSGKNSTPCIEKKIEGTVVIEVNFDPSKDMIVTCDCVGILKERNVDVEHRFPDQSGTRNKKKSTRCRMVFRTSITHPDGSTEILQTTSNPIVCTQPPGVPEICKKSLTTCPCSGGMELFILGKNFLKDTQVVFQQTDTDPLWEEAVHPDKEFLQQTHLVCVVPPYQQCDITEPVTVRLMVISSGKTSEPHNFTYTPCPLAPPAVGPAESTAPCVPVVTSGVPQAPVELGRPFSKTGLASTPTRILPCVGPSPTACGKVKSTPPQYLPVDSKQGVEKNDVHPVLMWQAQNGMLSEDAATQTVKNTKEAELNFTLMSQMPPPPPLLPLAARRSASSLCTIVPDMEPPILKTEILDENSQPSPVMDIGRLSPEDLKGIDLRMKPVATVTPMATVADLSSTQSPSMATIQRFVNESITTPLPAQSAQSVETFLSRLEQNTVAKTLAEDLATYKKLGETVSVPIMFNGKQSSGSSSVASESQKMGFVSNLTLPIFSSQPSLVSPDAQTKLTEKPSLQTSTLLIPTSPNSKTGPKNTFGESGLAAMCNSLASTPGVANLRESHVVADRIQESGFQSPGSMEQTSLGAETPVCGMANAPQVLETTQSLLFSPSTMTNTMLPTVLRTESKPSVGLDSSLMGTTQASLSEQLIGASQAQSSIISVTQSARLDALVSSAMEGRNQSLDSHIMSSPGAASRESPIRSPNYSASPPSTGSNISVDAQGTSPVQVASYQLSQDSVMMNSAVSALNNHLLVTVADTQGSISPMSPMDSIGSASAMLTSQITSALSSPTLALESTTTSVEPVMAKSPIRTSPVTISGILLNGSRNTAVDGQILASSPAYKSPISIKNILQSAASLDSEMQMTTAARNSQIAIKTMIINSQISAAMEEQMISSSSSQPTNMSAEKEELTKLVQSSMSEHLLSSSSPHCSAAKSVANSSDSGCQLVAAASSEVPTLVADSQPQQQSMIITQAPSTVHPEVCITTSITSGANGGVNLVDVMQQNLHPGNMMVRIASKMDALKADQQRRPTTTAKVQEGLFPQELTQMSDNELLLMINPHTFDSVPLPE